jgi:hypothetical protein
MRKSGQWGTVRVLTSGNYQASYIGLDGMRHKALTTFKTKSTARLWLASERVLIERDEWKPPKVRHMAKYSDKTLFGDYAKI